VGALKRSLHPLAALVALSVASVSSLNYGPGASIGAAIVSAIAAARCGASRRELKAALALLGAILAFASISAAFAGGFIALAEPAWLAGAALSWTKLVAVLGYSFLLYARADLDALGASLTAIARRLARRDDLDPGLYLTLTLSFVPGVAASFGEAFDAARVRGWGRRSGVRALALVLASAMKRALSRALDAADAIYVRGYDGGRGVPERPFRLRDLAFVALAASVAIGAIALP
jgi:energy-coupling factor transporter transmembrane protein EcfT